MRRALVAFLLISTVGAGQSLVAQTYDELMRENRELRARIAALGSDDGHPHEHDDHAHGDGHSHPGQDSHHDHNGHDHNGHAQNGHAQNGHAHGDHGHHCRKCETQFDYFCPFEDHHGGHGHCGLCGCGCNFGHFHGANGHGHGHEHQHGPGYHHSVEGYPILHAARGEFFFIERHFHFVLADIRGADDGEVDELEFEAEILYAINDRIALIAAVPVVSVDSAAGTTSGIGDLEFGFRFLAFNGRRDGIFFGLNMSAPTGDADRDLGAGRTALEPVAAWVHDFGGGTYMFNTATWEVPVDATEVENTFRYDVALLHTFVEMANARWFRYLTPGIEVNTETVLNGPDSGRMVVDLTPGVTWVVRDEDEIALGWSFPIAGDRNFDNQFLVNYIRHF